MGCRAGAIRAGAAANHLSPAAGGARRCRIGRSRAVMRRTTLDTGHEAEDLVDRTARRRGWKRIERNYNVRGGELDLVYDAKGMLVIVEVRYRARSDYGSAAASVTRTKQQRIVRAARHFLLQYPRYAQAAIRFDVVGVNADNELDWIENAFYAE
ncbi:hypothetical protein T35B1_05268 [Salinisphaera shabanensis T35B1]